MDPNPRPRIGLALGSGSARGWGHIGVLNRLLELGIRPDIVAGSSIGALVAAAYASGHLPQLEAWARTLDRVDIIRLLDPRLYGGGFIHGESLMGAIGEHVVDRAIEDLPVQFACAATDLSSGQEVWLNQGSVLDAVRASIALPGVFTPVRRDGRWLIDGGLVNPVPVSLARAMGAELIIAVNLNGDLVGRSLKPAPAPEPTPAPAVAAEEGGEEKDSALTRVLGLLNLKDRFSLEGLMAGLRRDEGEPAAPGLFDVLTASINIMQDRITRSRMAGDPPDVMITPRLSGIRLMEFDRAAEAIAEGTKAVNRRLHELEPLLQQA